MESNKGAPDLAGLLLFDPATGKEEAVESDPKGRVDFGNAIFSEATDELVATTYEDEKTRIYFRDKAWEADYRLLEKKLPNREILPAGATADDRLWMVTAYSDVDPGTRYLFDRKTKKLSVEYVSRERLPREHMAPMKPISYPSSDGLDDPGLPHAPEGSSRRRAFRSSSSRTAAPGPATGGASTTTPSSSRTAATPSSPRTSAAPPATGRSS